MPKPDRLPFTVRLSPKLKRDLQRLAKTHDVSLTALFEAQAEALTTPGVDVIERARQITERNRHAGGRPRKDVSRSAKPAAGRGRKRG